MLIEIHDLCGCGANHGESFDLAEMYQVGVAAWQRCLDQATAENVPLASLTEIEFSLVSDAEISRVHGEFMDDPTPTDVITFHHGEVLISPETAMRQSGAHGTTAQHEACLYIVHALLHLAGHEDATAEGAATMALLQERILRDVMVG